MSINKALENQAKKAYKLAAKLKKVKKYSRNEGRVNEYFLNANNKLNRKGKK